MNRSIIILSFKTGAWGNNQFKNLRFAKLAGGFKQRGKRDIIIILNPG